MLLWIRYWLAIFWLVHIPLSKSGIPYGLVVRIPGFHPGGPGSIPGVGTFWSKSFLIFLVGFQFDICTTRMLSGETTIQCVEHITFAPFSSAFTWHSGYPFLKLVVHCVSTDGVKYCFWGLTSITARVLLSKSVSYSWYCLVYHHHGGRVVKALDLRSNGSIPAWVRTPPVVIVLITFSRKTEEEKISS